MIGLGIMPNRRDKMGKCPHCEKIVVLNEARSENEREIRREIKGTLKKEVMYSCPYCERILGLGFFFGGLLTGRP
jgi:predicted  nucleic acid-binding Zn-ribbon protein